MKLLSLGMIVNRSYVNRVPLLFAWTDTYGYLSTSLFRVRTLQPSTSLSFYNRNEMSCARRSPARMRVTFIAW